jgi:peroxiredoxin family protein
VTAAGADLVILAHGGGWDRRFQVSSLAAATAASGRRVDLVLFFAALAAWASDRWDALDPEPPVDASRLAGLDFPPLSELLAAGRADGRIRLWACSASARILGLDLEAVQERVDVVAGWQTFSRLVREAERVVTL